MSKVLFSSTIIESQTATLIKKCKKLINAGIHPHLSIVMAGNDPASMIYTRNKKKFSEKIGARCDILQLGEDISEENFLEHVDQLNKNPLIHGIIIQLPVPKQLASLPLEQLILPQKDVDGFHFENIAALASNNASEKTYISCTPKGVLTLLKNENINLKGKHCVVIGRSNIVGRPLSFLLLNQDATVTICHSKTENLKFFTSNADIIFTCIGRPKFLDAHYIGTNLPIVIDVGINKDANGKLCGDVNFDAVKDKVSMITPVPGGIGPLTILSLTQNLLQAAENSLV